MRASTWLSCYRAFFFVSAWVKTQRWTTLEKTTAFLAFGATVGRTNHTHIASLSRFSSFYGIILRALTMHMGILALLRPQRVALFSCTCVTSKTILMNLSEKDFRFQYRITYPLSYPLWKCAFLIISGEDRSHGQWRSCTRPFATSFRQNK